MTAVESAHDLLNKTEVNLRDLGAEAAKLGNYDDVVRIAEVAKGLHALATTLRADEDRATAVAVEDGARRLQRSNKPKNGSSNELTTRRTNGSTKTRRAARRTSRKNGYPRFARRGDDLIKIGWSKGATKEYQHKAPFQVVLALAESLQEKASNGDILATDDFLPEALPNSGEEIPTYQNYVSLAWLRSIGVVTQHGRQGYSADSADSLKQMIKESWSELPVLRR
jgi:hypothetical protein